MAKVTFEFDTKEDAYELDMVMKMGKIVDGLERIADISGYDWTTKARY